MKLRVGVCRVALVVRLPEQVGDVASVRLGHHDVLHVLVFNTFFLLLF